MIAHLKEAFPEAAILLVSVGDREFKDDRRNGELRTMPGVKNLIRYQQSIAADSRIAFGICMKLWAVKEVFLI